MPPGRKKAFDVGHSIRYSYATNSTADGCASANQGMDTDRTSSTYLNYDNTAGPRTDYCYNQANQLVAKNLKGKLLLAHGTMDVNVPPYNTLLVVDELIKANKDFDLLMLPNRGHGFGNEPYMVRRRWDYFVRYLLGAEPPKDYQLHPPAAGRQSSQ